MNAPAGSVADAWRRLGGGDSRAAAAICRALLERDPADPDALGVLGLVGLHECDFAAAERWFDRALALRPGAARLHLHRGLALAAAAGREEEAMAAFQSAVALDAGLAEAHHQMGNMLKRVGRYLEAAASLRRAVDLVPNNAIIALNLGVALLESGRRQDAIAAFGRAVQLAPEMAEAHNILGVALLEDGRLAEAQAALAAALARRPDYAAAHNNRARVLKAQGQLAEAVTAYRASLAIASDPATHSNLLYTLNFVPDMAPALVAAEHRGWARTHAARLAPAQSHGPENRDPGRRLRIGFVSPDLTNHAVAYFLEPALAGHDPAQWEAICYSDAPVPDAVTARLRGRSDRWRDTHALPDERVAALVREDRIDLLVDLAGHTARNRLLVFARKPAAIQVTWLGYPNTTGLRAIDYRLTDAVADPPGETDGWHEETLWRMPRAFLCYQPPADSPPVHVRAAGPVTFGSFSNYAKISEPCVALWSRLLQAVPAAKLVLKSRGLADPPTAAMVRRRFAHHGIAGGRIVLDGALVSTAAHLRQYGAIDIALDPFPYNGTTTTCEALWMGVPVVTLAGATHAARVGASLLTHLGAAEWIARTPDDYVEIVRGLAEAPERRAAIRAELRPRMQRSAICDRAGFAVELAAAFRGMWRAHCAAPNALVG